MQTAVWAVENLATGLNR